MREQTQRREPVRVTTVVCVYLAEPTTCIIGEFFSSEDLQDVLSNYYCSCRNVDVPCIRNLAENQVGMCLPDYM